MGRRTTRRPGRRQEATRPSAFFLIALGIGLLLLIVMAVVLINRPAQNEPLSKTGALPSIQRTLRA